MTIPEIVGGVIVAAASILILVLTLSQHTKGQGLSGSIMGANTQMAASRTRQEDVWLAKFTRYAGIVLFVVTLLACVLSTRLG